MMHARFLDLISSHLYLLSIFLYKSISVIFSYKDHVLLEAFILGILY